MRILEQKIELKNSCELIGKSKDVFSPLKEAVTNSLDAISQRQKNKEDFIPRVLISINFQTSKNLLGEDMYAPDSIYN